MDGHNSVTLLGNLGADGTLHDGANGGVLKLRLATSESYLDRNKERQERVEWHSVVVFGKRAEALSKILRKGDRVFVTGSLRTSSYEKEGATHYKADVIARDVILNGKRDGADNSSGGYSGRSSKQYSDTTTACRVTKTSRSEEHHVHTIPH